MFSQTNCEEFKSTLARLSFLMFPLQPGQKVGVFKSTTASGLANESTCMWDTNQLPAKRWLTVPFRGNDESSVFLQFCFWMLLVSFFWCCRTFLGCLSLPTNLIFLNYDTKEILASWAASFFNDRSRSEANSCNGFCMLTMRQAIFDRRGRWIH